MFPFQRSQVSALIGRLNEPPRQILAVFGPRQTGKTTIVRQALQLLDRESRYMAADDPGNSGFPVASLGTELTGVAPGVRDTQWLIANWKQAREAAQRSPGGFVLAIDEIQRISDWSQTVKGLWDADRASGCPMHIVILGSAPLIVQSGLSESLAGRFERIFVPHWSFKEMGDAFDFDLESYLYFGAYPRTAQFVRDQRRWRDYMIDALIEPNIERDILAMTRVDKPVLLKRLFEVGAAQSGQILSYNKMLGQLVDAGNTTTLARYLDLLSSAGLLTGISKFSRQRFRSRASSPKLNVLNTGLMTAASGYTFDEARSDRRFWGRVTESAVGAHLCNTASRDINVGYWRESPFEVDFVLQRGPRVVAIEVKTGVRLRRTSGLEVFAQRFAPHRSIVVGDRGVPLNEFLTLPASAWCEEP